MRILILMTMVLMLAGCASTPAERSAQAQREMAQMIRVYGPACSQLGYQQETDPWRDCVLELAAQDRMKYHHNYHRPTMTQCFGHHRYFNCVSF